MSVRPCFAFLFLAVLFTTDTTLAQVANPELEACRATGLIALRERNPAIKDVSLDMDSMTVAKANTKVEDTPSAWHCVCGTEVAAISVGASGRRGPVPPRLNIE